MSKVVVCVTSLQMYEGQIVLNYSAGIEGGSSTFGSNYIIDPALTTDENLAGLWQQVVLIGKDAGVTLGDPTQFMGFGLPKTQTGAPLTKIELDAAAAKSDAKALAVEEAKSEPVGLMAKATESFKNAFNWMMG